MLRGLGFWGFGYRVQGLAGLLLSPHRIYGFASWLSGKVPLCCYLVDGFWLPHLSVQDSGSACSDLYRLGRSGITCNNLLRRVAV